MLANPQVLDDLVIALLLDETNPRRTQDGADQLQATAALLYVTHITVRSARGIQHASMLNINQP